MRGHNIGFVFGLLTVGILSIIAIALSGVSFKSNRSSDVVNGDLLVSENLEVSGDQTISGNLIVDGLIIASGISLNITIPGPPGGNL